MPELRSDYRTSAAYRPGSISVRVLKKSFAQLSRRKFSHLDAVLGSSGECVSRISDTVSEWQGVTDKALRQEPRQCCMLGLQAVRGDAKLKHMYFRNRAEAGRLLAKKMSRYEGQQIAVIALSPGAAIIGAQIAMRLHGALSLLLTEGIYLPGENEALGGISSVDTFTYNNMYSAGEVEEMTSEFNNYIEQQKLEKRHRLNLLLGHAGEIHKNSLRHHIVVVVSDGLPNGFSLDVAKDYLNTVAISKLVIACPIASVAAVDRMHLIADEIFCLSVIDNYLETNHYYDDNTIPDIPGVVKIMNNIALNWSKV